MTYTWQIMKLDLQDELNHEGTLLENSIVSIKWKRIVEDTDGTIASYVGNTKLSAANTAAADFVALIDVTNAMALEWVTNSVSSKDLERINEQLATKLERNRTRTVKPSW